MFQIGLVVIVKQNLLRNSIIKAYVGADFRHTCYDWFGDVALQRVNQADDSLVVQKEVADMIITNKLGFAITVIVGILVALYLFVKIITLIAESNTELHTKDTKQNDKPIKNHKPEYAKGRGDGCGQLVILIGATILLIMALIG